MSSFKHCFKSLSIAVGALMVFMQSNAEARHHGLRNQENCVQGHGAVFGCCTVYPVLAAPVYVHPVIPLTFTRPAGYTNIYNGNDGLPYLFQNGHYTIIRIGANGIAADEYNVPLKLGSDERSLALAYQAHLSEYIEPQRTNVARFIDRVLVLPSAKKKPPRFAATSQGLQGSPSPLAMSILAALWRNSSLSALKERYQKLNGRKATAVEQADIDKQTKLLVWNQYRAFQRLWRQRKGTDASVRDIYAQFILPSQRHYAAASAGTTLSALASQRMAAQFENYKTVVIAAGKTNSQLYPSVSRIEAVEIALNPALRTTRGRRA